MTCARFLELLRARAADPLDGPAGAGLLGHIESCPACRRKALRDDPSLLVAIVEAAERAARDDAPQGTAIAPAGQPLPASGAGSHGPDWTGLTEEQAREFWNAAAGAAPSDAPQPDWTGFNAAVLATIREEERRAGFVGRLLDRGVLAPRNLTAAAGIAAVLVLAAVAGWQEWRTARPAATPFVAQAPAAPTELAPPATPEAGAQRSPGMVAALPGLPNDLAPATLSAPLPVESVASPTARVIHLALGEAPAPAGAGAQPSDVVLILDETMDL